MTETLSYDEGVVAVVVDSFVDVVVAAAFLAVVACDWSVPAASSVAAVFVTRRDWVVNAVDQKRIPSHRPMVRAEALACGKDRTGWP